MARVTFAADEHIPNAVVNGLRERGVDAMTSTEAGTRGGADPWVLAHLRSLGRVVITHDADYLRLHAAGAVHAGIFYVPPDASIGEMIRGALLIAEVLSAEDMANHVEFL